LIYRLIFKANWLHCRWRGATGEAASRHI